MPQRVLGIYEGCGERPELNGQGRAKASSSLGAELTSSYLYNPRDRESSCQLILQHQV